MRVLSLFDGMSCGQIALRELGIIPEIYYACEVDKFAISQTQLNFPATIQLGDIRNIDVGNLGKIDILLGGSPCQSFSFSGKRNGISTIEKEEVYTLERYIELKKQGFEFEGDSYLFWEYVRILTELRKINPNILYLLENVEMGTKWEGVISRVIGVFPVHINSCLLSAQHRKRVYWSNIKVKLNGLFSDYYTNIEQPVDHNIYLIDILEKLPDEKFYLSDNMLSWLNYHTKNTNRRFTVLDVYGKSKCLTASSEVKVNLDTNFIETNNRIRRLTPKEVSRLQSIPEWYVWNCSNTQIFKLCGNGWTISVIAWILSFMDRDKYGNKFNEFMKRLVSDWKQNK